MSKQKAKFPSSIQTAILIRVLGEKGFIDIYEQYCGARLTGNATTPPTASQERLASLAKKIGYKQAAEKCGVDVQVAYYAVGRVAKYNYLKK